MKYAKWTLVAVILLLAASAAWAECPSCFTQPAQVQCPQPCPVPQQVTVQPCPQPCTEACVQPCPQVCPQACCPTTAVPSSLGAGPAANLQCVGCGFDATYANNMFAQNSVIASVTQFGMQRASDRNLRDISGEINGYMVSANNKLQGWYGTIACGTVSPDCGRAQAIIAELSATPASCFDAVYARTLSQLVKQAGAADSIGATQAATPQMRQQAQFLAGKDNDWANRLDRWVVDHGQAP